MWIRDPEWRQPVPFFLTIVGIREGEKWRRLVCVWLSMHFMKALVVFDPCHSVLSIFAKGLKDSLAPHIYSTLVLL